MCDSCMNAARALRTRVRAHLSQGEEAAVVVQFYRALHRRHQVGVGEGADEGRAQGAKWAREEAEQQREVP